MTVRRNWLALFVTVLCELEKTHQATVCILYLQRYASSWNSYSEVQAGFWQTSEQFYRCQGLSRRLHGANSFDIHEYVQARVYEEVEELPRYSKGPEFPPRSSSTSQPRTSHTGAYRGAGPSGASGSAPRERSNRQPPSLTKQDNKWDRASGPSLLSSLSRSTPPRTRTNSDGPAPRLHAQEVRAGSSVRRNPYDGNSRASSSPNVSSVRRNPYDGNSRASSSPNVRPEAINKRPDSTKKAKPTQNRPQVKKRPVREVFIPTTVSVGALANILKLKLGMSV